MNLRTFLLALVIGLAAQVGFGGAVRAEGPTITSVGNKLICMCGCTNVLPNCVHKECMVRDEMLTAIGTQLVAGKSEAEIIQSFVNQYGPQVLSAPTKKGFNLTAWILPFVALAAGGAIVYYLLKSWVWQGKVALSPALPGTGSEAKPEDDAYLKRLKDDLEKFE